MRTTHTGSPAVLPTGTRAAGPRPRVSRRGGCPRASAAQVSACLCVGLLVGSLPQAHAQPQLDSWTTENGLPQNSVNDILQTSDGYVWLATYGGLVRFDGARFVVFDRSTDGIKSQRIRTLREDSRGVLWAATEDGMLIRYRDELFTTYTSEHGLPATAALRIDEGSGGNLWITWRDKISKYDGTTFVTYQRGDFAHDVRSHHPLPDPQAMTGRMDLWWSRDATGLHCLYKGAVRTCVASDDLPSADVVRVAVDDRDNIWVSTNGAGVLRVADGTLRIYTTDDGLPSNDADGQFFEDRQGTLWFADRLGAVHRIRDGGLKSTPLAGLKIYQDHEDSVWIGTTTGLYRWRDRTITIHGVSNGLSSNLAYSILQDRRGDVWIGTNGFGVNRYAQGRFVTLSTTDGLPSAYVTCLFEDASGRLWVGTIGGLARLENGRFSRYVDSAGYLVGAVWAMHEDGQGVLWFATDDGLVSVRDQVATRYTAADGLSHDRVTALAQDRSGALWVGTFQGLTRLHHGVFTAYTEHDGLVGNQVRAIYEDADETLWIGTYDGGLYRLKAGRLTRYTTKDGLHDNGVFQILEDHAGYFWMGSNRGISRVSRRELNDFADGKAGAIRVSVFGIADGLSTLECNGGRLPSGLKTPDGKLWFPTMGGLAVVDPGAVRTNTQAPPVVIEALLVRGEPVNFHGDVRVSPDANRFEIRYTAPSFIKPEHLTFRHRLVGLDDGWEDAGDQRTATYYGVPPGRYQFVVSAANADGVWNADGASVSIVVLAPLWRQPWFMTLTGLATLAFGFLLDRRRVRRLRRDEARQTAFAQQLIETQEFERKRISTELHDSLGQDLFIIRAHVRSAREMVPNADKIEDALDAIGDLAQKASEDLKGVAHALRPYGLDKIGLASTIERMIDHIRTTCEMDFTTSLAEIDGRIDPGKHINVYRIVQEGVSNVVKHSGATRASVTLTAGERSAEIRIEDNGQGFRPDRVESSDIIGGTLGLMSMRERARSLGGQATIRSTIGVGTTVVVTFPLDERDLVG